MINFFKPKKENLRQDSDQTTNPAHEKVVAQGNDENKKSITKKTIYGTDGVCCGSCGGQ